MPPVVVIEKISSWLRADRRLPLKPGGRCPFESGAVRRCTLVQILDRASTCHTVRRDNIGWSPMVHYADWDLPLFSSSSSPLPLDLYIGQAEGEYEENCRYYHCLLLS